MRYMVNLLGQLSTRQFQRDDFLIERFKRTSIVQLESRLDGMDASQLLQMMYAYMESIRRPYCTRLTLIKSFERFSPATMEKELGLTVPLTEPKKKEKAPGYRDWHCMIFYLCNVLSYLTGENYDAVTELMATWITNDVHPDVKSAIHAHMRDLFARNLREQEEQSQRLHAARSFDDSQQDFVVE
ncbi:hypothetical protein AAVH_39153 [Aphelenchoides avenae]|nr:hypothetical protein AAVH_39153 [Aphelenchus avenae]